MWNTQTLWFDVAVVMTTFAVGTIMFGHFEEHKPKPRRLLKVAMVNCVLVLLSWFGLRWVEFALIGVMGLVVVYVHAIWLPKHGVNGWTGEPKDKYYELVGARRRR
jgi:hypothetical protein